METTNGFNPTSANSESIRREPETIVPPEGSYFIHGIKSFGGEKGFILGQFGRGLEEISISLQKDGETLPLRPYGYILEIDKGSVVRASARDMATAVLGGVKHPTVERGGSFKEDQMTELLAVTRRGSHNEIIAKRNGVEAVAAYVLEGADKGTPGVKKFLQACREKRMPVRMIPKDIQGEIEKPTESEMSASV